MRKITLFSLAILVLLIGIVAVTFYNPKKETKHPKWWDNDSIQLGIDSRIETIGNETVTVYDTGNLTVPRSDVEVRFLVVDSLPQPWTLSVSANGTLHFDGNTTQAARELMEVFRCCPCEDKEKTE